MCIYIYRIKQKKNIIIISMLCINNFEEGKSIWKRYPGKIVNSGPINAGP